MMELLAPVGNIASFHAALDAGADAVYVGAPGFNARNLARDLRFEEIAAMISYCRKQGVKFYLAANSLVREQDIPNVIESLAVFEELNPDALIVQDLAILQLVQRNFPNLVLHASTLMTANNSEAVRSFYELGFERVVLARELTIKEIDTISYKTAPELEVFVHGAMCFSYSGLCLFSSFLGGKSGLRGKCVQPCRRKYGFLGSQRGKKKSNNKGNYLFSMNDLSGLEIVPDLQRVGVSSLKIEGRLRSTQYVSKIVQAYRTVMDADEQNFGEALSRANILAEEAMSRKVSVGYFQSPQPADIITAFYSGNTGVHLGRISKIKPYKSTNYGSLIVKGDLAIGDRLRAHLEKSGDRKAFSLSEIRINGLDVKKCKSGDVVQIALPSECSPGNGKIDIFRIDDRGGKLSARLADMKDAKNKVKKALIEQKNNIQNIKKFICPDPYEPVEEMKRMNSGGKVPLDWCLKTDNPKIFNQRLPFYPNKFILTIDRGMVAAAGQIKKILGRKSRSVVWALPAVIHESDLNKTRKQIKILMRSGFKSFQLGHIGQIGMFADERVKLSCDYTFNALNSQSVKLIERIGFEALQLSIEGDRGAFSDIFKARAWQREILKKIKNVTTSQQISLGLTVYGSPALFTSRIAADNFHYDRDFVSPKNEKFIIKKKEGFTQIVPSKPFSLLPYLKDIKDIGFNYVVVDMTNQRFGKKDIVELADRLKNQGRFSKLPTFNYLGKIL